MAINTGAYRGARSCTSGPQPGAWGAMDYYLSAYSDDGGVNTGIYNCRSVRGGSTTSLHGEGRAADFGVRPYRARYGTALANALVAFSDELGIQCVIWNRRIWSCQYPHSGWRHYSGTASHTDHIHVEFTWARANASRSGTAKLFAKVLGGVKPGEIKIGGSSGGGGGSYGNANAKHEVGSRVMRKYTSGTDVRWLQKRLYKLGWDLDFDGDFGPSVEKVVRALQKSAKISVDGEVYTDTIKALKAAKVVRQLPKKSRKDKKADKYPLPDGHFYYTEDRRSTVHSGYWKKDRPAIRKIQRKVGTHVDGGYGENTKAKVARKQRQLGLKPDGAVGPDTWEAFF